MKRSIFYIAIIIISVGLGFLLGIKNTRPLKYSESRENNSLETFTNPLLECDMGSEYLSQSTIKPKKTDIENLISKREKAGDVDFVSVYYRDLNNGPWIGINEKEKFSPASLMKVPVMLAYYKEAETNPGLLSEKLGPVKDSFNTDFIQHFESDIYVKSGNSYSIDELIGSMIMYSDNHAAFTLIEARPDSINKTLKELSIELPKDDDDFISVRDYATFFRVLFNSSYLSKNYSEKALDLLSKTTFNAGLRKYLPKNIVVSSKFGEREYGNDKLTQIHDCGIVYYPKRPYLLCIMTRGKDINKITDTIASISKLIYDSLNKEN